jgi:hypothetical protein
MPHSPECVEYEFCKLRLLVILGSSLRKLQKILQLSDALAQFGEYGAIIT